jgi:hypothetical protein
VAVGGAEVGVAAVPQATDNTTKTMIKPYIIALCLEKSIFIGLLPNEFKESKMYSPKFQLTQPAGGTN